jgi:endonuclease/exonuclease/phosphatase family metal-dependent hydrolase
MSSVLTVATLNLYGLDFRQEQRAELAARQLSDLRPDIIGLQEVSLTLDRGNRICRRLNELLAEESRRYRIYHMANTTRMVTRGAVAVMTHLPALYHDGVDFLEELDFNRVAHRLRVDLSGSAFDFYNTHLHYLLGQDADEVRCRQATKLLDWMDSHGWTVPKVLVGDFNAWPHSEPVRILKEKLRSSYEVAHGGEPNKTWPSPLVNQPNAPQWTLDYIFVTPHVRVHDARVVFKEPDAADPTLYPSDHFGLAATIEVG